MCSLSICKLAAVKMPISHIASKAGGLRGMLTGKGGKKGKNVSKKVFSNLVSHFC